MVRRTNGVEIEERYKKMFPALQYKIYLITDEVCNYLRQFNDYNYFFMGNEEIIFSLEQNYLPSGHISQMCVTDYNLKNDFIYFPTWHKGVNATELLGWTFEKEMNLILYLIGFNLNEISFDLKNYSIDQIQRTSILVKYKLEKIKSLYNNFIFNKEVLKHFQIFSLPGNKHLYAIGIAVDKHVSKKI